MALLSDKRLLIVSGKGGVGKTAVATALGLRSVQEGSATLLCEVNTEERITRLLEKPEVGPQVTQIEEQLWAVDIRPPAAMREYALMTLKFESIYNAVFENRLVRSFLRFLPSLQELVMLGKILFHLREKSPDGSFRFDRIIVDAPATGHAVSFLSVPQVLLDTVPPGPLAKEAAIMRDLLVNPRVTAAVLVSLPEEMPVNETIELCRALRNRVRVTPVAVVLNAVTPPRFTEADLAALDGQPALLELAESHRDRAALSLSSRQRLESELQLPVHGVPRLDLSTFGREAVEQIASSLSPLLGKGSR